MVRISIHNATGISISDTIFCDGHAWRNLVVKAGNESTEISVFGKYVDNLEVKAPAPGVVFFGPNHCAVNIGRTTFFYSYAICVAYSNPYFSARIDAPSQTSARYMKKMGIIDFPILDEKAFFDLIS